SERKRGEESVNKIYIDFRRLRSRPTIGRVWWQFEEWRHLLVDCCVCSGLKVCAWKEWQHLQVEGVAVQGHLQQWSELIQIQ
uniref:Uncharacterized protein n=1 Tax=Aegilops tauschii subsp. strangulata TaxID=200361 RepID=A0A452ZLV7_AEGTS